MKKKTENYFFQNLKDIKIHLANLFITIGVTCSKSELSILVKMSSNFLKRSLGILTNYGKNKKNKNK